MRSPWLVVVSGPPGSGKTRLAAQLVRETGWPCLAKDAFKEALFDSLGTGDAAWSRRLSRGAFAAQFTAAAALLDAGHSLLLEGNFTVAEHAGRVSALAAGRARLVQVACRADPALLAARHAARARDGARHPGHLDAATAWDATAAVRHAPLPIEPTFTFDSGVAGGEAYTGLLGQLAAAGLPVGAGPGR